MTNRPFKPNRTEFEKTTEEKKRYLKRIQEDEEAKERLDEYLDHPIDDEESHAPTD